MSSLIRCVKRCAFFHVSQYARELDILFDKCSDCYTEMKMCSTAKNNSNLCKDTPLSYVAEESPGRRIGPSEKLILLAEAAKLLPRINGRKISVSALWRWTQRGLRGSRLDSCRVGRRVCTTRRALLQFFRELTELDRRVSPDTRSQPRVLKRRPITSRQRQRALAEAAAILERAGI